MSENQSTPNRPQTATIAINAEQGSQVELFGTLLLGLAFLIVLLGYMRAQGRIRRLTEKLAKVEQAAR